MDGKGALYGLLTRLQSHRCFYSFSVDLPNKHGPRSESLKRFERLRIQARHNYLRKVAETATAQFVTGDRPNISGLVIAGSAQFKNGLPRPTSLTRACRRWYSRSWTLPTGSEWLLSGSYPSPGTL